MAKAMTDLERLLYKALLAELCRGGGNEQSMKRWAQRTAKRILKLKVSQL